MDYLEYKGYRGSVEYSKSDRCLYGKVLGMNKDLITYEGDTLEKLEDDFRAGIDDYIAGCRADGVEPRKPFSGNFVLRIPSELHYMVASAASQTGTTINEYIKRTLEEKLKMC